MTNHPNRSQSRWTVTGDGNTAKFSNYKRAMEYAAWLSAQVVITTEVRHKTGIVGQYRNGVTTSEFREHHNTLTNCPSVGV